MNFNIFTIDRGQARALACTVHTYIFNGKNKRCENQRLFWQLHVVTCIYITKLSITDSISGVISVREHTSHS